MARVRKTSFVLETRPGCRSGPNSVVREIRPSPQDASRSSGVSIDSIPASRGGWDGRTPVGPGCRLLGAGCSCACHQRIDEKCGVKLFRDNSYADMCLAVSM